MSAFGQNQIGQYGKRQTALLDREKANAMGGKRCCVHNDQGQEN
jgi:hypothetical protein